MKKHIVILGAGYGGLMTATRLQKTIGQQDADITLVNKNDYHYEATWLHELAAGTVREEDMIFPIQDVLKSHKVNFVQDTVVRVDKEEKKILLNNGELSYDYLVIALGFESETFGIKGLKENTFSMTNIESSKQINEHIERQFSAYEAEEEKKAERLTIVVGGAGFTGVEFLGELTDRMPKLCQSHHIDSSLVRIVCVEASPSVLFGFDQELIDYAVRYLESKGVEFKTGTAIKEASKGKVLIAKGEETEEITAETIIWSAGVRGSSVIEASGFESNRGKVKVDEYLRVPGNEEIFIIGDCALVINPETNRPYPPTAQIATQHGEVTAHNLSLLIKGKNHLHAFRFINRGTVCSLGEHNAVGTAFGRNFTGKTASALKKVVDDRSLFLLGGVPILMKKGKFNFLG